MMKKIITLYGFAALGTFLAAASEVSALEEKELEQKVAKIGGAAALALSAELKKELVQALASGGPEGAVGYCSTQAMQLTAGISERFPEVSAIKRTSNRYRNPQNAPDEMEKSVLAFFEQKEKDGKKLPEHYITRDAETGTYRYYRPLMVDSVCLTCHGPRESLTPGLRAVLNQRYPQDKAVGYQDGAFRGLIRVTVNEKGDSRKSAGH